MFATTGILASTEWSISSTMSRRKKRNRGGSPALYKQTQATKRYGPFITYLRSLTFLKNTFVGCIFPAWLHWTFIRTTVQDGRMRC